MDNKNTETEVNQDQFQEELYAEITEHDVVAPVIKQKREVEEE